MRIKPKKWFADIVGQELTVLCFMRLEGHPSEQMLNDGVKDVWVDILWGNHSWTETDEFVLRKAFKLVRTKCAKWIQPVQFSKEYIPLARGDFSREIQQAELIVCSEFPYRKKIDLIQSLDLPIFKIQEYVKCLSALALPKNQTKEDKGNQEEPLVVSNEEIAEEQRLKYEENLAKFKREVAGVFEKLSMENHLKEKERARQQQLAKEQDMKRKMDWATRMDLVKMKKLARAHSDMICAKTEEICPFWQQLNWAISDIEAELQDRENAITRVPDIVTDDLPPNEPVKKRRKKVAL